MRKLLFVLIGLLSLSAIASNIDGNVSESTVAVRLTISYDSLDIVYPENVETHVYLLPDTIMVSSASEYNSLNGEVICHDFSANNEYLLQIYEKAVPASGVLMHQYTSDEYNNLKNIPATWVKFSIPQNYDSENKFQVTFVEDSELPVNENGHIVLDSKLDKENILNSRCEMIPILDLPNVIIKK